MKLTLYQTLEDRENADEIENEGPFICKRSDAWLGVGYYFWDHFIENAHWWGKTVYDERGYVICSAKATQDDTCWDLHNNYSHMDEFNELAKLIIEDNHIPKEKKYVSYLIEFMKRKGMFKYLAIRATPINSVYDDKGTNAKIQFRVHDNYAKAFIDVRPAIQICLIRKKALNLQSYLIVHPAKYF